MNTKSFSIELPGKNTMYVTPDSGNVGDPDIKEDHVGITVTWTCSQAFTITFRPVNGSPSKFPQGPQVSKMTGGLHQYTQHFAPKTSVEYDVETRDPESEMLLTLDPYIGVTH